MREVLPATREQRCWFHRQANVLAALPTSAHPGALAALKDIYNAEDVDKAQLAIKAFEIDYGAKYLQGGRQDRRNGPRVTPCQRVTRCLATPLRCRMPGPAATVAPNREEGRPR